MAGEGNPERERGSSMRPQMCPACRKLIGVERVCPYCGADSGSIGNRARAAMDGPPVISVTGFFVVVNILFYVLVLALGGGSDVFSPNEEVLLSLGLQHPGLVEKGEWWRLVLPIFLHLGILHLLMNTLVLWVTGRHLEHDIGGPAFFFMYITAGVLGFVASQFAGIGGGGASGAVAGILGCTIVKRRLSDGDFSHPVTMQAIQLVLLNAIFGLVISKVNNTAHLGGLLTGAALGAAFALWQSPAARRVWLGGAALTGGLVLASVAALIIAPSAPSQAALQRAWLCANKGLDAIVEDRGRSIQRGPGRDALRCFEGLDSIGEKNDKDLATMRDGLERALQGEREGNLDSLRQGLETFDRGYISFASWLKDEGWLRPIEAPERHSPAEP
jgi:membrane associated rhomboid family serine protease